MVVASEMVPLVKVPTEGLALTCDQVGEPAATTRCEVLLTVPPLKV